MGTICNVNEYDCWIQSRGRNSFDNNLVKALSNIIVCDDSEISIHTANELKRGLSKMFGVESEISKKDASGTCVIVGTASDLVEAGYDIPGLFEEGYIIKSEDYKIVIAGADKSGVLYGVYRLLKELSLGKSNSSFDITDKPDCGIRMINHWDNINGTLDRGYAGRSIFFNNGEIEYDPQRIEDYARLLAFSGINRISINNVNVRYGAKKLITEECLPQVADLAAIFRPFGIRIVLCINFASPFSFGDLETADPLDDRVALWWKKQADIVYKYVPDLAGFLVKADSEGEPGPFRYGRNHADGANMLARALKSHGGDVIWRCFVYNSTQDWRDRTQDRPKAAYDHFVPLDGTFDDNVILQIKNGPLDFQVYEPVSPLFGVLKNTRHFMEFQITQEYTGQQIDLCYLPYIWESIMKFDTKHGENSTIGGMLGDRIEGVAGVGNVGLDNNWTGNTLAQANLYGYGRIIWNHKLTAEEIAKEWAGLTFGEKEVENTVVKLLMDSYPTFGKYNCPFGVSFMVSPNGHYGPNIEGYEYSKWGTYHRANHEAIGIDRTASGTGYTTQYPPENDKIFSDKATCPENMLLFFHRVRYDYIMSNGKTLLQNIYNTHFEGYDEVVAMIETWKGLENKISSEIYSSVLARFERQLVNAYEWRDQINTYFWRTTGIGDELGRKIYD